MKKLRFLFAAIMINLAAFAIFAQDAGGAAAAAAAPGGFDLGWLVPMITGFAVKYPWLATVLIVIGTLRTIVKPLVSIVHSVVEQTPSQEDDKWLDRVERSKGWAWFVYALDWFASVKLVRR